METVENSETNNEIEISQELCKNIDQEIEKRIVKIEKPKKETTEKSIPLSSSLVKDSLLKET